MINYNEIAKKCISKKLSGTFVVKDLGFNQIYYLTNVEETFNSHSSFIFRLRFNYPDHSYIDFHNDTSVLKMFKIINFIPNLIIIR